MRSRRGIKHAGRTGSRRPAAHPQIHAGRADPPRKPSSARCGEELPDDERELFQHLTAELRRMRSAAVHEVLGVPRDAGPDAVRAGWKNLDPPASSRSGRAPQRARDHAPRRGADDPARIARTIGCARRSSREGRGDARRARRSRRRRAGSSASRTSRAATARAGAAQDAARGFERPPTPTPAAPPPPRSRRRRRARGVRAARARDARAGRSRTPRVRCSRRRSSSIRAASRCARCTTSRPRSRRCRTASSCSRRRSSRRALAHHEQCVEAARLLEHLRKHGAAERRRRCGGCSDEAGRAVGIDLGTTNSRRRGDRSRWCAAHPHDRGGLDDAAVARVVLAEAARSSARPRARGSITAPT